MKTIKSIIILLIISVQLTSCNTMPTEKTIEKWKQEVITTELNFSKMAGEKGISEAFLAFAADDAVLMRMGSRFCRCISLRRFGLHLR